MMDQYLRYLQNKQILKPSQRSFYVKWATDLDKTCNREPGQDLSQDEIDAYLSKLVNTSRGQVDQAKDAVRLYLYYLSRCTKFPTPKEESVHQEIGELSGAVRSKKKQRLPTPCFWRMVGL